MSYIISSTNPFVSVKLTDLGRQQLALGQLNFSSWAIGDSEINYEREAIVDANLNDVTLSGSSKIMRPFDKQPNIKYFITPSNSTSQFQELNPSNTNVIKAIVNNEAQERGFFDNQITAYTTSLSSELTPNYQVLSNTNLSGGTVLALSPTATTYNVGDYIMIKLNNDNLSGLTVDDTSMAIPNLWFKIQSVSSNLVTLDRELPNYSGDSSDSYVFIYRGGEVYESIATGNTTAYWDSGTLSFNSNVNITCNDVPVWNMNNVWCENLAGMSASTIYEDYTKFGSYQYLGAKNPYYEYLCENSGNTSNFNCNRPGISYLDEVSKSISIIHYTNNAISNLYGEFFYIDATNDKMVIVELPNLMYHRSGYSTASGTTMGMRFIASGITNYIGDSDIEYVNLIEHPDFISSGTTPLVVGKVFPQLKTIVFDDDEIVAAISYKSNRNWTLPPLAANIIAPSGGTSNGLLGVNKTMYLTYALENNHVSGLTSSLPCQKYIKVTNNSSSPKDVTFRIESTDLLPYMRKIEDVNYDGYGFYADTFKLLYQIVDEETQRPNPGLWKSYDFTTTGITENVNETINPLLLENQTPGGVDCGVSTGFIIDIVKDNGSSIYDLIPILNMAPNNQPSYLQFGDERFFYGNIKTFIGATIYKTIFDIRINSGLFNTTTNPTRSLDPATNPANIRISEVGIYDSNQNLVCIGKLSKPVSLTTGNTIMLELSMDF